MLSYILNINTVRLNKILESGIDKLRQIAIDIFRFQNLQPVISWVLEQSSEKVRPGEIIKEFLFVFDCSCDNLSVYMVRQNIEQTRLNREWLVEELLVERFFHVVHQDNCYARIVELWSTCSTNHLQNVGDGHIDVPFEFSIVILGSFDHYQMCWEVDATSQSCCCYQNLKNKN